MNHKEASLPVPPYIEQSLSRHQHQRHRQLGQSPCHDSSSMFSFWKHTNPTVGRDQPKLLAMMHFWMARHSWSSYFLLDRTREGQLPFRGQGKPFGRGKEGQSFWINHLGVGTLPIFIDVGGCCQDGQAIERRRSRWVPSRIGRVGNNLAKDNNPGLLGRLDGTALPLLLVRVGWVVRCLWG